MKRSSKSDIPRDRSSRGHPGRPQFDLSNKQKFEGPFPVFQLPKLLGSFSLDKQRSYLHDSSQLRYICLPDKNGSLDNDSWKVRYDLTVGVEEAVEKDEDSLRNHMLDDLLTWILRERKQFEGVDIVCFRGLLTLIIASPYENNTAEKSWTLVATRYRKVIYLWQIKDDENEKKSFMRNPMQRHMCIWGFKFEQYLCADSEDSEPDPKQRLDTNAEFCCVLKTRLGNHHLLYGAEIDAVKKNCKPPWDNLQGFVELKTNRFIENQRQQTTFHRFKLLKWWAQSFLVGIPTVICGYRNDKGIVSKLESIPVKKMPSMAKDHWNGNICMNFCQQFLEFVSESMGESDNANAHYLFNYDAPNQLISMRQVADGEMQRSILPQWYVDSMDKPVDV